MAKTEGFAEEKKILEFLRRIERNQSAYSALYVYVSKLKPKNRHPLFVKVIARLFDGLVGAAEGQLFVLENGDFVIIGKNITSVTINNAVGKLRKCLASDPILMSQEECAFTKIYMFPEEFIDLGMQIEEMMINRNVDVPTIQKFAIEAKQLESVKEHLDDIDVAEIVKHQSILRFESSDVFKSLYQEFFVAVKDLSLQYNPSIDLVANKWLFLYLTQILDKKTISSFKQSAINNYPQAVGLNLNLSSVFSDEFKNLISDFTNSGKYIIAEVQLSDMFNSLNLYFEAKKFLHDHNCKMLVDGLTLSMLQTLDIPRLQPDLVKIFWDPIMEFDTNNANFKKFISDFGSDNIILAKCKDVKSIRWGIKYGIRNFQGPYIDNLEVELVRKQCPNGGICTTEDCLKRRRLIVGAERDKCVYKDYLEKILE
ncbi:MAG: hypothetical protein E7019_01345 [Alphaproteobacteria bacterium]|nr:hypothetical protein [Alphaproteobacteria bacterium]